MAGGMSNSFLANELSQLANPAPLFEDHDPEEDVHHETAAKLIDKGLVDEEDEDEGFKTSKLRKKNNVLLHEVDVRYAGKKVSRRDVDLDASDGEESPDSEADDDLTAFKEQLNRLKTRDESEGEDEDEDQSDEDAGSAMEEDDDDDDEEEEEEEEADSDVANDASVAQDDNEDEDDDAIQKFSKIDIDDEVEKGKAVKSQLSLWDNLLDCRIKLHKVLNASNRLPQHDMWDQFATNEDFLTVVKSATKTTNNLFNALLKLQTEMLERNPETQNVSDLSNASVNATKQNGATLSDEEIPSDTEEEEGGEAQQKQEDIRETATRGKKRKLSFHRFSEELSKRHRNFCPYRNTTIQKWSEKMRLASGKITQKSFAAFEQSTLKQIEQIMLNKPRLIARTQLKRTAYQILGKQEEAVDENVKKESSYNDNLKDCDTEIFDDDDFYHQLLREIIERKTSDCQDPIALSRKWLEIQKLRSKMKRNVDTKASKGRKIRFDAHPKLENFMAPVCYFSFSDGARNDIVTSLFGKRTKS